MWKAFSGNSITRFVLGYGSLFTSLGTLLCCALPSALVLLGFGAGLASFLGKYPQLIWLSEHKEWVFGISFGMLFLSFLAQQWSRNQTCPIEKKEECIRARSWSRPLLYASAAVNLFGAFYAFVLPSLL